MLGAGLAGLVGAMAPVTRTTAGNPEEGARRGSRWFFVWTGRRERGPCGIVAPPPPKLPGRDLGALPQ